MGEGTKSGLLIFLSANADLSALTTTAGTITPTICIRNFKLTSVNNATTNITITPTKSDSDTGIQAQVNGGGYSLVTTATASELYKYWLG
jgi:hypothetical protein